MKEQTPIEMGDCIETKEVRVLIQANGIIRNTKGRFLARLDNEIDFDGEHIFEDDCNAKVLEALEREKEDLDFIYSLLPKWTKEVPEGYGEMFYGTLSYKGDLKVKERVDKILRNRSKTKV
jgi:hypothetical protein